MLRFLKRALLVLASIVLVLIVALALWLWLTDPKRPVDSVFVRPAGEGVFTWADIPKDRDFDEDEVDTLARRLLAGMSLQEKVLQMSGDQELWSVVKMLVIDKRYNTTPIPAGKDRRLGIPPLLFSDGARGVVLDHSTCFPVAIARAASWDPELERRVGDAVGQEIRAQGANLYGGVCVNLLRHPSWGRAQETYGEDPWLVGVMGAALTTGVQVHNVMATVKHYALNSIEETRTTVDVRVDERTLREVYLPHFHRVVDAGVAAVMSAYNKVNGDYCAENPHLLREILREDWGFRGFVMSDFFLGVHDAVKAANAGLDLEMPRVQVFGKNLEKAVEAGEVPVEVIDEAVLRLLRRKIEYLTAPDSMPYVPFLVHSPEHVALAREAAEKGMVLLENRGPVLPLDRAATKTLAVIGPLADAPNLGDHGSSRVEPPEVVTPLAGLRAYLGTSASVVHDSGSSLEAARQAAKAADAVVVVVGLSHLDEGEYIPMWPDPADRGGDREDIALHPADRALVEAVAGENPKTVVVLVGGSAITVEGWVDKVAAVLMAFYPGEQGGAALARVLFGDVDPGGRLPFTVPRDPSQLPPFDNTSTTVEYGPYHGYTLIDREGEEPRYPFGYGLSYTAFAFAHLELDANEVPENGTVRASIDVTNTGPRAGDEVVQLYMGFEGSAVERPVKLLRDFARVSLAPGQTRRVSLEVKAKDLAYYDVDAKRWVVERVPYRVLVGSSSRESDLISATFRVVD